MPDYMAPSASSRSNSPLASPDSDNNSLSADRLHDPAAADLLMNSSGRFTPPTFEFAQLPVLPEMSSMRRNRIHGEPETGVSRVSEGDGEDGINVGVDDEDKELVTSSDDSRRGLIRRGPAGKLVDMAMAAPNNVWRVSAAGRRMESVRMSRMAVGEGFDDDDDEDGEETEILRKIDCCDVGREGGSGMKLQEEEEEEEQKKKKKKRAAAATEEEGAAADNNNNKDEDDSDSDSDSCCSTPRAEDCKIPSAFVCPPAPKKMKMVSRRRRRSMAAAAAAAPWPIMASCCCCCCCSDSHPPPFFPVVPDNLLDSFFHYLRHAPPRHNPSNSTAPAATIAS